MRVFVDMDDICVDLLSEWLKVLNSYPNVVPKTEEEIVSWNIELAYPTLTRNQIYQPLCQKDFWERVQPIKDAYKYLKLIKEKGHEVYIATASYPDSYAVKTHNCLFKHFDFIGPKDVICINDKSLLDGDILFDDYHENLRNFKGVKVLRNRPYNANCDEECFHIRVNKWKEFYQIVRELDFLMGGKNE